MRREKGLRLRPELEGESESAMVVWTGGVVVGRWVYLWCAKCEH